MDLDCHNYGLKYDDDDKRHSARFTTEGVLCACKVNHVDTLVSISDVPGEATFKRARHRSASSRAE